MANLDLIKEQQQARKLQGQAQKRAKLKEMGGKALAQLTVALGSLYAFNYSYGKYGFERTLIAVLVLILIAISGLKQGGEDKPKEHNGGLNAS